MDDLKSLRALRADAPEPDADRLRALRARSLRRRHRFRPVLSLSMAMAATVAVIAAVVVVVNNDERSAARPPVTVEATPVSAEVMLRQAALTAEKRRPDRTPPRPDQWLYRKSVGIQPADGAVDVQEHWTRYDGTRQATRLDSGPVETRTIEPDPGNDDLSPRQYAARLARLPTDPDRLLAHVKGDLHWRDKPDEERGLDEPPDARAFRVLSLYLGQEVSMPPKLEAAIFRALARIPGVRVDLGVRDAAGRAGMGIAYEVGAPGFGTQRDENGQVTQRSYVILDSTTYRYLGSRTDYLQDYLIKGEVAFPKGGVFATAEVAAGVVDEPGQIP
ncbi:CU044_5270 family protein [Streptosporangium sp. NBC_01495]|uniref:CU044_5270 family protein n=1 Tax=Streptosporangium sp. NBC_01495 TaxID=2903899 RepID=UPI002E34BC0F|nr:CU044_5270 family protein [Streptosporangium sp. NBC_01495]